MSAASGEGMTKGEVKPVGQLALRLVGSSPDRVVGIATRCSYHVDVLGVAYHPKGSYGVCPHPG